MRPLAVVALVAVGALACGCSSHTETTTTTTSDNAGTAGTPAAPAMTFTWNNASNCVRYQPGSVTMHVGNGMNFNNSAADTVWVTAPAGCFSAAETTFAVLRGASPTVQAYQVGSYVLTTRPPACAPSGGPGPAVVVDSGAEGGK
jgi:hypothetical protein